MREIKFRGQDKRRVWHYGYLWETPQGDFMIREKIEKTHHADFEVDKKSIGQFTGLKDKNGKEIYEGDIVKIGNNINIVEWSNEGTTFNLNHNWVIAVIGNISDNPELLEEQK